MNHEKKKSAHRVSGWIHSFLSRNKIKYGTLSVVMIAFAFVLFVSVNFVFELLDVKIGLQTDMTTQKMYSLSPEAREYLTGLTQEVTLTIVQDESKFDPKTVEALRNFDLISEHISFQYVDLDLNPVFAEAFRHESIHDSSIIIQSGSRYQILDETDLYYLNSSGSVIGLRADQKLCSAISFVCAENQPVLGIISGHGGALPSELRELCGMVNRDVSDVSLLLDNLPDNTDVLVIYEPTVDFVPEEIKKIDDFLLEGDKNLVVIMDAQAGQLPVLESYLAEWGLEPQNDIVIDADHYWGGNEIYLLAGYSKNTTVGKSALDSQLGLAVPLCRSITLNSQKNNLSSCQQFPIIKSFDTAYSKKISGTFADSVNSMARTAEDETGSFVLGAGSTKLLANVSGQEVSSTVFVYGSALMAGDSMLVSSVLGNRTVLLDSLLYNKQKTDIMDIPITALKSYSLEITSGEISLIRTVTMYLLPIGLCLAGGAIWIRRKKR